MNDKPIDVLLVEDNPGDVRLIREMLKEAGAAQFELACADQLSIGLKHLAAREVDAVLLDLGLPDSQGLDTFTRVFAQTPEAPIIVLTGLDDESLAVQAVRAGAQDYLVKGQVDGNLLARTMRYAIERKRAERALQRSKREWETTFDAMSDWVCLLDLEARILRSNRVGEEVVGAPLTEMVGQVCCKLVHGTEEPIPGCPLQKMLQTHQRESAELQVPDEDRWLMVTVDPVMGENGNLVGAVHIVRDITERRRAEEELRQSEERYHSLFNGVPVGINRTTPEGQTIDANPALVHMLGYPDRETLLAVNATDLYVDPEVRRRWQVLVEREGVVRGFEVQLRQCDGTVIWVRSNTRAVCDADGRVLHYEGSLEDITERKKAEEELENIFNLSPDMVAVCTTEGKFLKVNPSWEKALGYTQKELLDLGWTALVHPDDVEETNEQVEKQLKGGSVVNFVNRYKCKDGSYKTFEWQATFAKEGIVHATARDITERKRAEEELQHTLEKLREALGGIIQTVALTVETKDPYTAGHQRRVGNLARAIANEMGLPQEQIDGIRMAGLIHDLGKVGIPAEILSKPSRLNDFEWGIIKTHSQVGHDILKTVEFPWPLAQIVLQHHERLDGSGYPRGLSGEEVMLEARILAVADVVEAMASFRPYRQARGMDKAVEEISQNRGILYDAEVVDVCLKLFTENGFAFE